MSHEKELSHTVLYVKNEKDSDPDQADEIWISTHGIHSSTLRFKLPNRRHEAETLRLMLRNAFANGYKTAETDIKDCLNRQS